jgi:hypothetical protein
MNSAWKKKIKELKSRIVHKRSFFEKDGKIASVQYSKKI